MMIDGQHMIVVIAGIVSVNPITSNAKRTTQSIGIRTDFVTSEASQRG